VAEGAGHLAQRPIFGRQREIEQLQAGLVQALAGRGRFFTVVGEPGIGKTRLLDELTETANQRGMLVLWGRSWESGGAPAYWPWIAVLEGLVRSLDDVSLRECLGPGAAALATLLPDLDARLGRPATATPPSADEARFRLWRAVAGLVRRAAIGQGLLLAFEDLHAADESSLALLHFLAREVRGQRLLLLASYRDAEAYYEPAVGELLGRIAREGSTLALGRLPKEASLALLEHRAGPLDAQLSARICERAQGNPLFLEEMSRLVDHESSGSLDSQPIPLGVRELIRQRLDRLQGEARALLDLAAVIGDEIDPRLLAAASGQSHAIVVERLAEASRAALLHGQAPRIRFAHALLREALYQGLEPNLRQRLHAEVARALIERDQGAGAGTSPAHPAELAHHLLAGPAADLPRAIDVAVIAAHDALAQLGYEEAVQGLERAAHAVEAAGNPGPLRAKVALALGAAHIRRGDLDAGRSFCREAARAGHALGDTTLMATAALTYGEIFTFGVVDPVLIDLLDEALAAFPEGDHPLRISLHARLAAALQPTAKTEEPAQIARQAIAGARRLGDRRILLRTLQAALGALMDVAPPRERLALNLEAESLAFELDDRDALLRIQGRLVVDHMGMGDFTQADARIDAFEAQALQLHAPWVGWRAPLFRSMRAMLHGRFAESEALIADALRIGKGADSRDPQVDRCVALHRESLLRVAERHDEGLAHDPISRRQRAEFFRGHLWHASSAALLASRMEDHDKTRFHLDLIPPDARPFVDNLFAVFHLAEPAALVGDRDLVASLHQLVLRAANEDVMLGMTQLSWEGPATRLLALLEVRLGRWDEARAHFEAAITRLDERDARPLLARTRYEYGRAQLDRDPGSAAARELIAAAAAQAEALQMPGLVRLARARLGQTAATAAARISADLPVVATPPAAVGGLPFQLVHEGEVWAFRHREISFRLKDSLGLRYLGRLLAEPDREVHVLDLVAAGGAAASDAGEVADGGDAGELLDDEARASYRQRLEDLRDQLSEAESFGDPGRAAKAREELEFLTAELGRAVGLGGRARRAGSAAERARSAVQRRIKNALGRIEGHAPELAAYLGRTIKTGNFCAYRPGAAATS
jgi:hypothetical protein